MKSAAQKMAEITAKIEKEVRARRYSRAKAAIRLRLTMDPSIESRIAACDAYRRLGDFKSAYRVISPDEFRFNRLTPESPETRQCLWSARILNLMGASSFALNIANRLPPFRGADENFLLANLYLANFDSASAIRYFDRAEAADRAPERYSSRVARIGACDARMGIGAHAEALARLKRIPCSPEETLLRGMLRQAEGEYHARLGRYRRAQRCLADAKPFFTDESRSLDGLFLRKWIGIADLGAGEAEAGLAELAGATRRLRRPEFRAELWLDCVYWKQRLGHASGRERALLAAYPGLPPGFTERYADALPGEIALGGRSKPIWISFPRSEWRANGEAFHSLPKEIELLGHLRRAYPCGIATLRLATLLWPDEIGSFLFLEGRLHQLLRRLRRRYGIAVRTRDLEVFLEPDSARKVAVEIRTARPVPMVFEGRRSASLEEVSEFYRLRRTQAYHLVRAWTASGRVSAVKTGRTVSLVPSADLVGSDG